MRWLVVAAEPVTSVDVTSADMLGDLERMLAEAGIELHFAAMSYVAPSAVRYRYRMEGFDRDWRDAGNERAASYYRLHSCGVHYCRLHSGSCSF